MRARPLFCLILGVFLGVAVVAVMLFRSGPLVKNAHPNLDQEIFTNKPLSANTRNTFEHTGNSNLLGVQREPFELFKTIVDQQSGEYAVVNSNRSMVTLKDKNNKVIWSTNVIEAIKNIPQDVGGRDIRSMFLIDSNLWVKAGREYITIEVRTGHLEYQGNN